MSADIEGFDFNTAISALTVFVRDIERDRRIPRSAAETLVKLLAPLAPHLAEELWERLGRAEPLAYAAWPEADPAWLKEESVTLVVQVSGKLRARVPVPADAGEDGGREIALRDPTHPSPSGWPLPAPGRTSPVA